MSKALMGAVTRAFCNGLNLYEYCDVCFDSLNNKSIQKLPKCFIRNDIAHFIHMICRWKCFQVPDKSRLKEFYVRCSRLLLQSRTLAEFSKILTSILIIAYSETEYTSEQSLNYLIKLLEGQPHEEIPNLTYDIPTVSDITEEDKFDEVHASNSYIVQFLNNIHDASLNMALEKQQGINIKINAYYLLNFGKQLFKLCSTFPVWSNVMVNMYCCPNITASSAPVESDFNNLKNRILKNESKPMKVDRLDMFNYIDRKVKLYLINQIK